MREPLFILTPNRSLACLAAAMLGAHPDAYGTEGLNVFLSDRIGDLPRVDDRAPGISDTLIRVTADLAYGDTTGAALAAARTWLSDYPDLSTTDLFRDLMTLARPRQLIDASVLYGFADGVIGRIGAAFPDACYLHLSMHPRLTCELAHEMRGVATSAQPGREAQRTELDPRTIWYQPHMRILDAMVSVRPRQKMFLRGEELLDDAERTLVKIVRWLGLPVDEEIAAAMMLPERSLSVSGGNAADTASTDPRDESDPAASPWPVEPMGLDGPLSWDPELVFEERLKRLARVFGY